MLQHRDSAFYNCKSNLLLSREREGIARLTCRLRKTNVTIEPTIQNSKADVRGCYLPALRAFVLMIELAVSIFTIFQNFIFKMALIMTHLTSQFKLLPQTKAFYYRKWRRGITKHWAIGILTLKITISARALPLFWIRAMRATYIKIYYFILKVI